MKKLAKYAVSALAVGVLLVLAGCYSVPVTGRSSINLASDTKVIEMSFEQFEMIKAQNKISRNPRYNQMVQEVGDRIASVVGWDILNPDWEFVVFDNDVEGIVSFNRCRELNVPDNMRIVRLPDVREFCDFETIGPNGRHRANINGQGAAIECYLDLDGEPCIRWNNYNGKIDAYQGELIGKDRYMRTFLNQRKRVEGYNYGKIASVLDMIITNCVRMREAVLDKELED